ncbi:tubulin-tyrosine ligase family protein, putative [Ichthyophthirius multifiliis]|uniref:Tubulin-tyrosine ligase family protein, putative n=1 Tax=Ichthyophthirius multifiliis TaxID=5932 RepID=G0QXG4_ICHMU|nr:tubulin-tyrosine ligase family protein, putative [Ichthyophthirius multifiliis]EGR30082.1 tubulin-tyrosine ligase family protein, putative [Ichthyophthirius multifiliis]|eukprot:XP_004031318.1 tubulin-tyrosine ligase family protein, putative [Ichthyophthirius multifiliis]
MIASSCEESASSRSLTPCVRGNMNQNSLKVLLNYNQQIRKIVHPIDIKQITNINSDLKQFFKEQNLDLFKKQNKSFSILEELNSIKMHNHLENNWNLSNKKAMFINLKHYYLAIKQNPFDNIPITFHIKEGLNDPEYHKFMEFHKQKEEECKEKIRIRLECKYYQDKSKQLQQKNMVKPKNIWIIKPGEVTNRGIGITVTNDLEQIQQILRKNEYYINGKPKTYIVQKYIDNPLLYQKRKFDIRCYLLICVVKGNLKAYWYQDGYIRTSCKEFNCKNLTNRMIHLTNDAVQKKCDDYGKYELGNKLSYNEFQIYIDSNYPEQKFNFHQQVYQKMKQQALDCVKATFLKIDPLRREMSFEIFGLDYMISDDFKTWLIEVNTNPCLELSSPLLAKIIPNMIENSFRIAIDPIFSPPQPNVWNIDKKNYVPENFLENNKFLLIFDEKFDGPSLKEMFKLNTEQDQQIIIEENDEEEEQEIDDD